MPALQRGPAAAGASGELNNRLRIGRIDKTAECGLFVRQSRKHRFCSVFYSAGLLFPEFSVV